MSAQKKGSMENKLRRSSRRIRGLAPQIDVLPSKDIYLPPEMKAAVLAQLEKKDLKAVRLVSKEWNALATKPLFDRVYISCRAKDMEVFKNVTRHPVISTSVTELAYDSSLFGKIIDFEEYFDRVSDDLCSMAQQWQQWQQDVPFDSGNVQTNKFFQSCRKKRVSFSKLYRNHKKDTFLVEGYRKYRDHSAFECHCIENGLFSDDLRTGLSSLNNLRSVVVNHDIWEYTLNECFRISSPDTQYGPLSGSPVCRSWNPFYLRPRGWRMLSDVHYGRYQMCAQFHMLTWAIRAANKNIISLQIPNDGVGGGLPQQALIRSNLTDIGLWHLMTAYSSLRCLDIHITTSSTDHKDALTVLPELLMQTRELRRLSLRLSQDNVHPLFSDVSKYYQFEEIFPAIGVWPKLTKLSISGLAVGGWDLLMLVSARARLRQLELSNINLLDGTWEGVVEGMRRRPRLTELRMMNNFKHCGGTTFRPCRPYGYSTDWTLLARIEFYVAHGGRHPCLTPECDAETAWGWYLDLIPEKELENLRLFARELDLYSVDLFRK